MKKAKFLWSIAIVISMVTSLFTLNVVSATGTFSVTNVKNMEEQSGIKISFSEELPGEKVTGIVLKRVSDNSEKELTVVTQSGNELYLTYTGMLYSGEEYAVSYPENLTSASGNKLIDKYSYFSTNDICFSDNKKEYNYNNDSAFVFTNYLGNQGYTEEDKKTKIVETNDSNVKAFVVETTNAASNDEVSPLRNLDFITYDNSEISMSIKPLMLQKLAISYATGGTPVNIQLWADGNITVERTWLFNGYNASNKIGTYTANDWINFKVVMNKVNKTVKIYVNDVLMKTLSDSSAFTGFGNFGGTFPSSVRYVFSAGTANQTQLLYMDNIILRDAGLEYNYNDGTAGVYTTFAGIQADGAQAGYNVTSKIVDTYDEHEKAYSVVALNNTQHLLEWLNFTAPSFDVSAICFDIKPLKLMKTSIRIEDSSGKEPQVITFLQNGRIVVGKNWLFAEDSDANLIGTYSANEWTSFKVVFDKVNKVMTIYLNGRKAKTIENLTDYTGFKTNTSAGIDFMIAEGMGSATEEVSLFLFDNIKKYECKNATGIESVRYITSDNSVIYPYGKTSDAINSIVVKFSNGVKESTLSSDTVKLFGGNVELTYNGVYDSQNKTYTIVPLTYPGGTGEFNINLKINGVTDNSGISYGTYDGSVTSSGKYIDAGLALTDSNGEVVSEFTADKNYYVRVALTNYMDTDNEIVIMAVLYNDKTLENIIITPVVVPAKGNVYRDNESEENEIIIVPTKETTTKIKLFAWDSLSGCKPLKEIPVICEKCWKSLLQ